MSTTEWNHQTRTVWTTSSLGVTTSRPYTAEENAAADAALADQTATSNREFIENQAGLALAANKTFLGIQSPTNAQIAAQVKALTRQNNGLIRLLLNRLEATE